MVSCDVYLACTGSPVVESEDEDAYIALYDWKPLMDNQLWFYTGDCIHIVEKNEDGWWLGYLEGKPSFQGYIPSNYIQKKLKVQEVDCGSCKSGSSTPGVSSVASSSKVSGNSTISSRSSNSSNLSQYSGTSSSGGERPNSKMHSGLQFHLPTADHGSKHDSTTSGIVPQQFHSNWQSSELREKSKPPELIMRNSLLRKPLQPPHIRQGGKGSESTCMQGEEPKSPSSSPIVPRKGSSPIRTTGNLQERLRRGSPLEDLSTKTTGTSNIQAPVPNPTKEKKPFNPTSETSCSLLDSPIFRKRAAAVAVATAETNIDYKQGEHFTSMSASTVQPSITVQQNNNKQKWQALYKYTAADDQELSLQAGDVITVDIKSSNNQWLFATFNGHSGFVPANYVKRV